MFISIIVTYHFDQSHVKNMILELSNADLGVIVFDNSPLQNFEGPDHSALSLGLQGGYVLGDGVNYGLATAFNKSIEFARVQFDDIEGFLFFDQDSTITTSKVSALISEYSVLKNKKIPVGVLGAYPFNPAKSVPYDILKKNNSYTPDGFINVEQVISSFSLVPVSTFDKIGLFDERLFIDMVDTEFCFRCARNGLLNLVVKDIFFDHCVGEKTGSLLGVKNFAISSPIRNYYQARNIILVAKTHKLWWFCISWLIKRYLQVVLSSFYSGSFMLRQGYFFKGVVDGLKGKGGMLC